MHYTKVTRVTIFSFLLIISEISAFAQTGFEQLINAGPADAEKLIDAYSRPLLRGFGLGMNSGWTNTAQTLGLLHFDLRISGTGVIVPSKDRTFDVTQIGLSSNIRPSNLNDKVAQTFSGSTESAGPTMDVMDANNNKIISFELPGGVLEKYVPTPQIQLTVGLFANTDFTLRATPKIKIGKKIGSVSLIGFGIKHNLMKDLFGKVEKTPVDLALAFSYNRLRYEKQLNLQPIQGSSPRMGESVMDYSSQKVFADFNNYLIQIVISKQFAVFTPYLALGYNLSNASFGLRGNYPIIDGLGPDGIVYRSYINPVSLDIAYLDDYRMDAGFQIKLPILRIFASYGYAKEYRLVNAGVGFGF
jgi:hypothetical protein